MATESKILSDLPIPPGELLTETLETLNLSQSELARRMERPVQAINEIARGAKEITPETAIQLERVLGVPSHIWLGLETEYQHTKARLKDRKRLEEEVALTKNFPCPALVRLGWIPKTRDPVARAEHLLSFSALALFALSKTLKWRHIASLARERPAPKHSPHGCGREPWKLKAPRRSPLARSASAMYSRTCVGLRSSRPQSLNPP